MRDKVRYVQFGGKEYEVLGAVVDYRVDRDWVIEDLELSERSEYHELVEDESGVSASDTPVTDTALLAELDNLLLNQLEDELLRDLPEPDNRELERADYELDSRKDS